MNSIVSSAIEEVELNRAIREARIKLRALKARAKHQRANLRNKTTRGGGGGGGGIVVKVTMETIPLDTEVPLDMPTSCQWCGNAPKEAVLDKCHHELCQGCTLSSMVNGAKCIVCKTKCRMSQPIKPIV